MTRILLPLLILAAGFAALLVLLLGGPAYPHVVYL